MASDITARCARCHGLIAGQAGLPAGSEIICACVLPIRRTGAPESARRERRLVTVLFADIGGSLSLISGMDPEQADEILSAATTLMLDAVAAHHGSIARVMGDGIMALFGAPHATEHHATRAAMAALQIRQRLTAQLQSLPARVGQAISVRVGLNSGEVVVKRIAAAGFTGFEANGEAVHIAARMEQLSRPGTILMTAATAGLIARQFDLRPRGLIEVKGLARQMEAFELLAPRSGASPAAATVALPMVGRAAEVAAIQTALEATARGTGQAVLIRGRSGTGKTRLVEDTILPRRGPALVLDAGARPDRGGGYRLIADLLAGCPGLARSKETRGRAQDGLAGLRAGLARWDCSALVVPLAALLGLEPGDPGWLALTPGERRVRMQDAALALITRLDAAGPLILLVEDLHWADAESQQVLDRLVAQLPQLGLLLVATARPGYRCPWQAQMQALAQAPLREITLGPLDLADLRRLIGRRLTGEHAQTVARRLARHAEGNPLFAQELLLHLTEAGVLAAAEHGRLTPIAALPEELPTDLPALLAARLAGLPRPEARVLEAAAVIGTRAPLALLRPVAAIGGRVTMLAARLQERGLLAPATDGAPALAFRHEMVREGVLAGLSDARRAVLHGRLLDALAEPAPGHPPMPAAELARHARLARRWHDAAHHARHAALAALARDASDQALSHLTEALTCLDACPDGPARAEAALALHLTMREPLIRMGRIEQMATQLEHAAPLLMQSPDGRSHGLYYIQRSHVHLLRGDLGAALGQSATAHALALRHGDAALAARARFQEGLAHFERAAFEPALLALQDAARLAATLSIADSTIIPAGFDTCVLSFVARARAKLGRFAEAESGLIELARLAGSRDRPYDLFFACLAAGSVFTTKSQPDAARPWLERAAGASHGGDMPLLALIADTHLGLALVRDGAAPDGVDLLQATHSRLEAMGFRGYLPLCLTALAEGNLAIRDLRAALALAGRARALARRQQTAVVEILAIGVLADCALAEPGGSAGAAALLEEALAIATRLHLRPLSDRLRCRRGALG